MAEVIETLVEGDDGYTLVKAVVAYWIAVTVIIAFVVDERGRSSD